MYLCLNKKKIAYFTFEQKMITFKHNEIKNGKKKFKKLENVRTF